MQTEFNLNNIYSVKVENITPYNNNTKSLFNINLKNNKEYLDTQKTSQLIKKGSIDFNEIVGKRSDYKAHLFKIESSDSISNSNCNLNLPVNKKIEDNKEINMKFYEIDNPSDNYEAKCSITSGKKLNCDLDKNITRNNFIIEDYLNYDDKELTVIYLPDKTKKITLFCNLSSNIPPSKSSHNLILIIIIAGASVLLIIIITIILCCIRKKKREDYNNDDTLGVVNHINPTAYTSKENIKY